MWPTAATCGSVKMTRGESGAVAARVDARVAAEDHVGGDAALVLAHVREQRAAVDVADRVEPIVPGHAQLLVDLDVPARLEPDRLEPEVGRRGTASDADEDLVSLEHVAVLERQLDDAVALDADRARADVDVDAARGERRRGRTVLASSSSRAIRRGPPSTIDTCEPSDDHAWPSSTPTTPPPRMSSRAGTMLDVVPSRFVHACASASPGIGGISAPVPVASTIARRAVCVAAVDVDRALAGESRGAAQQA